jgi:hypothetical protein
MLGTMARSRRNRRSWRTLLGLLLGWALLVQSLAGGLALRAASAADAPLAGLAAGSICGSVGGSRAAGDPAPARHDGHCPFCGVACLGCGGCAPLAVDLPTAPRLSIPDAAGVAIGLAPATRVPAGLHASDVASRAPPAAARAS